MPEETKTEKAPVKARQEAKPGEKIFTIPLRKAFRKSSGERADYAVSLVREFLKRHMKSDEIKIGEQLNKKIWESGNSIPRKVRVKTFRDGETVKAELMGFEYKDFKALPKKTREGMKDKLMGRLGPKALQKQKEEEMVKGEAKAPEKQHIEEKHEIERG